MHMLRKTWIQRKVSVLKISIFVIRGAMKLKFSEELDLFVLITNQLSVEPQPSTSRDISNPGFSKIWFTAGITRLMIT